MTTIEPQIPDTAKLPIGKAAEVLDVNRETLRKYAYSNEIRYGRHKHNKRMFFTGRELKRFWAATL